MRENIGVLYRCMELRIQALHACFHGFHLHACGGCEAPAFQQPCLVCHWYPNASMVECVLEAPEHSRSARGSHLGRNRRAESPHSEAERANRAHWRDRPDGLWGTAHTKAESEFIRQVEEAGNVALWYTTYRFRSLDEVLRHGGGRAGSYDLLHEFKQAIEVAGQMEGLPSAEEIVQMTRAKAHRLRLATELRQGQRIEYDGVRCEVRGNTFAPGERQSTHQRLTIHKPAFGEYDIVVRGNDEFLLGPYQF